MGKNLNKVLSGLLVGGVVLSGSGFVGNAGIADAATKKTEAQKKKEAEAKKKKEEEAKKKKEEEAKKKKEAEKKKADEAKKKAEEKKKKADEAKKKAEEAKKKAEEAKKNLDATKKWELSRDKALDKIEKQRVAIEEALAKITEIEASIPEEVSDENADMQSYLFDVIVPSKDTIAALLGSNEILKAKAESVAPLKSFSSVLERTAEISDDLSYEVDSFEYFESDIADLIAAEEESAADDEM